MRSTNDDRLLTISEVSDYLQVPVQTLYHWRYRGTGPKGVRVGRHVRYRQDDVDAWLDSLEPRSLVRHRRRAS
jgi:excisionase family DNA binding protein